ncbi:Uncharacterised protein [Mycobacteroides abscessus subsp. abscessus]|nr:Uncharacterised protein [Mycobacteroides abscessus subsp. abscessus]SHP49351.1 Uncharacterised protein [Mycobacteroides abscessus subsp. abscessus]SHP68161.1 Uncharacterised protein [Mycobacteroides abscessus subsp. abscessus]SHQ24391.1 Uncharacterised protein [Mycobacteroides abscessus subsp. abscessus]SHR12375.1 Uncharacterised protein [Mycobacteroides abscessus subsp. abscessus]
MNDWKMTGAKLGNVSRSTVFMLWNSGELGSVKVGRRRFSTDRQLTEYIAKLEARAVSA